MKNKNVIHQTPRAMISVDVYVHKYVIKFVEIVEIEDVQLNR